MECDGCLGAGMNSEEASSMTGGRRAVVGVVEGDRRDWVVENRECEILRDAQSEEWAHV